ncbi:Endoglucanase C precursor [Phycisphaerae bacterium RAS1]|nr:Endoglucanase C precursor [Phycisphaerae bacterium RAS1]
MHSRVTRRRAARADGAAGFLWTAFLFLVVAAALLWYSAPAHAITILWQAPNTDITLNLPFGTIEFEDPLSGAETLGGYRVVEWRDADYGPGPSYEDWTVSHPGAIDGNASEIWLRSNGHSAWTSTNLPTATVAITMDGDDNDGIAEILVDNTLVARLDMGNALPPDTALIIVKNLAVAAHTIQVDDKGIGPSNYGDEVHIGGAAALQPPLPKWEQPPQPGDPGNVFYGWNEYSVINGSHIVADDWVCQNQDPIIAIRWWGSFLGWTQSTPPVMAPARFRLTIWTDVPAGSQTDFSHPGQVVWETDCANFTTQFVGWDLDPRSGMYEACFLFEQQLTPDQYFYQTGPDQILWLGVAAQYDLGMPPNPFGWKTRPRDATSLAPDDAVIIVWPLDPHIGMLYDQGFPIYWPTPDESWDMAFELSSRSSGQGIKWDQPPMFSPQSPYPNCFWGWDELSHYACCQIMADDYLCSDARPITDIHWWGSYRDWQEPIPPPFAPDMFRIGIWTDVPVGPGNPFSHPGQMIREWIVPRGALNERIVGCDYFITMPFPDACFQYDFIIPPGEWWQQPPMPHPTVYWVSIAAWYVQGPPSMWPWGWKTREHFFNDDAVRILAPPAPVPGMFYEFGEPLFNLGESWDMAFRLTTEATGDPYLKWSQPPVGITPIDALRGWNEPSRYNGPQIAADDWVCNTDQPVTDIHWWGSFLGWTDREPPSDAATQYHIAIWTDVPSGPNEPFSHPGVVLWETLCTNPTMTFVGHDFDPRNPGTPPEACFKFDFVLPQSAWFYQGPGQHVYWISIAAVYPDGSLVTYPFGMKTRPRVDSQSPDDAVRIFSPTVPVIGEPYVLGEPLFWPEPFDSWDLCFTLTTHEIPPEVYPKWTQLPHETQQGFDAASDLYWTGGGPVELKWIQTPNPQLPGLHAHDASLTPPTTLADQWQCEGGVVTDLHWWGNYELDDTGAELRGSGVQTFHLSIHANIPGAPWCLPGAELWSFNAPFAVVDETATGTTNNEGSMIYFYSYVLPTPFAQTAGSIYWVDITANSNNTANPAMWRWQEHSRAPIPRLCPAAKRTGTGPWTSIGWTTIPPTYTDLAFAVTSTPVLHEVNKVVADDFISDGRPIRGLRYWGSYFDDRYAPGPVIDPLHVVDGWLVSFHEGRVEPAGLPNCPPGVPADPSPTVLGVYFAPASAVVITPTSTFDCFNRQVYRYEINLSQCCLLCAEVDPRNGAIPATSDAFFEVSGYRYWLDIQAVTGVEWLPPDCVMRPTGHLPSDQTADGHFWGWHTSRATTMPTWLDEACTGMIVDFTPYPPACWDYGQWIKQPWLCPTPPPPVNMAFELLTNVAPGPQACCLADGTCIDVMPLTCVLTHNGTPRGPGTTCATVPPLVMQHPADVTACEGDSVTFTVIACGAPTLTYQWRLDGSDISGATASSYTINPVGTGHAGSYDCVVTNASGSATSNAAVLTVWRKCDSNCDGNVNILDINPFILAINSQAAWEAAYDCDYFCANDINGDGVVNILDINPFVACLTQGQ